MLRKPIAKPRSKIACWVADSVSPQERFLPRPRLRLQHFTKPKNRSGWCPPRKHIMKCETPLCEIGLFNLLKMKLRHRAQLAWFQADCLKPRHAPLAHEVLLEQHTPSTDTLEPACYLWGLFWIWPTWNPYHQLHHIGQATRGRLRRLNEVDLQCCWHPLVSPGLLSLGLLIIHVWPTCFQCRAGRKPSKRDKDWCALKFIYHPPPRAANGSTARAVQPMAVAEAA